MTAVFVNMAAVILGSSLGIIFRSKIKQRYVSSVIAALALVTVVIGVSSAVETENLLCVIICMALGTALGELLRIDDRIEGAGDFVKDRLLRGRVKESRFTEGFVSAFLSLVRGYPLFWSQFLILIWSAICASCAVSWGR